MGSRNAALFNNMKTLRIKKILFQELIDYGNSDLENEVIEIGLGYQEQTSWVCTKLIHVTNVVKDIKYKSIRDYYGLSEVTDYIPDPNEFLSILKLTTIITPIALLDLALIFHTHPMCLPNPSITDIAGANYKAFYMIYSPLYNQYNTYFCEGLNHFYSAKLLIL